MRGAGGEQEQGGRAEDAEDIARTTRKEEKGNRKEEKSKMQWKAH